MVLFYRENDGDYLAIDTTTNAYCRNALGQDHFEGRAAAVAGLAASVCTTGVARVYLKKHCKRVAKERVPEEWRKAIEF